MAFPDTDTVSADPAPPEHKGTVLSPLKRYLVIGGAALCLATAVAGQVNSADDKPETEEGIPVTDDMTTQKCGGCHTPDAKGNMSRISWLRTTPEGWAQAIKRMVKLNGLQITPEESRHVVRYLSNEHGLAPEEARPVMYVPEHRIIDEINIPSESVRGACAACHAFGQPLSWRRSSSEWKLLQQFHVALYSQADTQYRRPAVDEPGTVIGSPTPIVAKPGSTPITQGAVALEYMRKVAPLRTAEWTQWSSRMQTPRLAGKWLINAFLPGKGRYFGTVTIAPGQGSGEFKTGMTLHSLDNGSTLTRSGSGIVYAGYSWRGRSTGGDAATAPDSLDNQMRETMWFSPDRKTAQGRWFWGDYQEFGFDVKMTRADGAPTIAAVSPNALKAGSKGAQIHIYGDSLPTGIAAKDIDLGSSVSVTKVVSASPSEIVVSVDAAANAMPGLRDVAVGGAVLSASLPVYRKVAYIKVTPETALSRLGGGKHPKGYGQFDAIGFDAGPDGKPYTADDINIGVIPADWSVQDLTTTWYDDDVKYVGKLSPTALFTPNVDGPNPERSGMRNNYGDVWIVATARNEKDSIGKPLIGKAYLVVTVPAYKQWDQPEVAQ